MDQANIFDALEAEQDAIYQMLSSLDEADWQRPSSCDGWTVGDVVLHLAQTEEAVVMSISGEGFPTIDGVSGATVDELMASWVEVERGSPPPDLLTRWDAARTNSVQKLRAADPDTSVAWAATPLKPRTLATTRLSEHWIHANDIADPLGADYADTSRLWHIAWLAHRTIPFAYLRAGKSDPPSVRLELISPDGDRWEFGDNGADVTISGSAGEFVRVAARRLVPSDASNLKGEGERASEVLELVRTYA